MCGLSGLPKLRLFVIAVGSAPTHTRFRAASAIAIMAPVLGSR